MANNTIYTGQSNNYIDKLLNKNKPQSTDYTPLLNDIQGLDYNNLKGYVKGKYNKTDADMAGLKTVDDLKGYAKALYGQGGTPQPIAQPQQPAQPIQSTPAPAQQQQKQPGFKPTDNTSMINKQNDTVLQSTIDAIRAAVQQAKNKQNQIIQQAPEQYGKLKNIVFNQSLAALPGMNENTANLGASSQGGYSRTEQGRLNSDMQNKLNNLNMQQQDVIDQANFVIADLESQGRFDEANATKEVAMNKLQQILAESARLDNINADMYQFDKNFGLQEGSLTGDYNGQRTMQGQQFDYGKLRDTVMDERYTDETTYNRGRDTIGDQRYQNEFDYNKSIDQRNFDEQVRQFDTQFTENQRRWNQEFTFDQSKQSFAERQTQIDNAVRSRQLTNQEAELQLQRDRFKADQDPNSIDNQLKAKQSGYNLTGNNGSPILTPDTDSIYYQGKQDSATNTVIDNYNKLYVNQIEDDNGNKQTVVNKRGVLDALKSSVESGSITEEMAKRIASYYGITL